MGRGRVSRYTSLVKWCSLSLSVSVCVSEACFSCYQLPALSCRVRAFRSQGFNTLPPSLSLYVKLLLAHSQPTVTAM